MRDRLERITSGACRYLMMSCPPRHGKTEQNTIRYVAWRLERDPTTRVILGAYNQTLAKKFSRKIRKLVEARGVPLDPGHGSVDDWGTAAGGGVRAAGVGVGITGMGADLIVIDDPVKSRREAESEVYRRALYDWYTDDLFTRQEPGCAITLTMTRWHEADLVGQILTSDDAASWEVVNLPAIAEEDDPLGRAPGEALCPDRYPIEELERRKRVLRRNFYALFQGSPRPAEGNKFKRSWFRYWARDDEYPDLLKLARDDGRTSLVRLGECRLFITVDLAASVKKAADYTVFAVWAVTPRTDLVLLDLVREQIEEPDVLRTARDLFARHRPGYLAVEAQGLGLPIVQAMRRGGGGKPGLPVRAITTHVDKISRAANAIVRVEAGQVFFPCRAPWLEAFEAELLSFPGAHDDQVDVLSTAAEDVFWMGGSPESDSIADAREQAEQLERSEDYHSIDNDEWWNER